MRHTNNFNLLRLAFALMVIVAHAFALVNRNADGLEPFLRIFGTWHMGEFAVHSFFILSGFLLTGSWLADPRLAIFLRKRLLRILPGFFVAVAFCMLVVGPLSTPTFWSDVKLPRFFHQLLLLKFEILGFPGNAYQLLNGSIWTIHYEFVCYLCLAILGIAGVLRQRRLVIAIAMALMLLHMIHLALDHAALQNLHGAARQAWIRIDPYLRLSTYFFAGAALYHLQAHLRDDPLLIAGCVLVLAAGMFNKVTSVVAMGVAWPVLLYIVGRRSSSVARRIGSTDISYGVYLYAWPIQQLAIANVTRDVWTGMALTVLGSVLLGLLSWRLVEEPALRLKSRGVRGTGARDANVAIGDAATVDTNQA
jgi:peptidoglycan/LPS O-acetylase OafA/YrhL